MNKLVLKAGVPAVVGVTGRHFRIFQGVKEVQIEFYGSHDASEWSLNTPLTAGIGLNFTGRPAPFTQITVTSDIDQTLEYWAALDGADDDRLSGSLDFNGSVSVLSTLPAHSDYNEKFVAGGVVEIVPINTSRRWMKIRMEPYEWGATTLSNGHVIAQSEEFIAEWLTTDSLSKTSGGARTFQIWETYD